MHISDPLFADLALRALGVCGFFLYITLHISLQFGWIAGDTNLYSLTSVTAACLVLLSLGVDFNLPAALIQVSWITIGSIAVLRRVLRQRMRARGQLL